VSTPGSETRRTVVLAVTLSLAGLVLLWVLYLVRHVLLILYISGLLAVGFSPIVRRLEQHRIRGKTRHCFQQSLHDWRRQRVEPVRPVQRQRRNAVRHRLDQFFVHGRFLPRGLSDMRQGALSKPPPGRMMAAVKRPGA